MSDTSQAEAETQPVDPDSLDTRLRYLRHHPFFRRSPLLTLFRMALWRVCCWLGLPAIVDLPRFGARFYLPPLWGGAGTTMIYATRDAYETELANLDRFLSAGGVAIDAGANCGIYTIAAARLVGPGGRVIAFEPGATSADVLERNVALNGLENVHVERKAVSDREGTAKLFHHRGAVASSIAAGGDEAGPYDEVPTATLDATIERAGVARVDFLKMDIEGAEELALRGAETILAKHRPIVVFEMNPSAVARFALANDGAWRHLAGRGYAFFEMSPEDGSLRHLAEPPPEDEWEFLNVVAIHESDRARYGC